MNGNNTPNSQPTHQQPPMPNSAPTGQQSPGIGIVAPGIGMATPAQELSPAMKFLEEFRKRRGSYFFPVRLEMESGWWFECGVKTLSDNETTEVATLMATKGHNYWAALTTEEARNWFWAAFTFVSIRQMDDEETHYFDSMEEALSWQSEPALTPAVNVLRGVITQHNPYVKHTLLKVPVTTTVL